MEAPKPESLSPLARLKAQQEAIQAQIQEIRKPSPMIFALLETTSPDNSVQHDPNLANRYDALFLTRQGNQAIIGYLTQRDISYEELAESYREKKELEAQGIVVKPSFGDQPGESLNFHIGGREEPSVTLSKVPISGDPRFTINDDIPEEGVNLIILHINLDDFKESPLIREVLNYVARYNTITAYLPQQFVYNENYGDLGEAELKQLQDNVKKINEEGEELLKLCQQGNLTVQQIEGISKFMISDRIQRINDYPEKHRREIQKELTKLIFTKASRNPLILAAINSIGGRHSNTKFYYGEKSSEE